MAGKFSEEDLASFRTVFNSIDTDGNQLLDRDEFQKFADEVGSADSFPTDLIFLLFDENNDGKLSFDEFVTFLTVGSGSGDFSPFFERLFKKLDKDNNGTLDVDELVDFIKLCKVPVDPAVVKQELVKSNKKDLTLPEFLELLNSI
uniref:EF-hand family protein n=1 Tax=Coptotermes formosanus TaxID=36987 RepID=R4V143_COPFO|nr:EF-hand family protein [Coptotermes formosanus]